MFERIHQKLGTAGFVISIIALVAALGGGAYAATSNNSGQATASAKAKQGKQGKPGKPGKTGPAGPAGPAGATGPAGPAGPKGDTGAAGTNGTNGTNGTPGAAGKSVTLATEPEGANCGSGTGGGVKVEVEGNAASKKYVCNGSPWTAGGTLPAGKTETGTWNVTLTSTSAVSGTLGSISFPIPLEASGQAFVFTEEQVEEEEFGTSGCTGEFSLPVAPPGVLCVFTSSQQGFSHVTGALRVRNASGGAEEFGPTGAVLYGLTLTGTAENPVFMGYSGTWAVTAPQP